MAYIVSGLLALVVVLVALVWFGLTDDEKAKFSFFVEEIFGKVWALCVWVWDVVTYLPKRLFALVWEQLQKLMPWLK